MPKSKKKQPLSHVPQTLMNQLKAIASAKFDLQSPTHAQTLAATIEFLAESKASEIAESIESVGTTMSWLTSEIDRLRAENEALQKQLDDSQQEKIIDTKVLSEAAALRRENHNLRADLEKFQQLKKLLGHAPEPAQPEASPPPEPKRQRNNSEAIGLEKIDRAISTILAWNDTPDRTWDEKWFISIPTLQDLLRSSGIPASQPRLKKAMDARREEIDGNHRQHQLGRRHNVRHDQPISTVLAFTE